MTMQTTTTTAAAAMTTASEPSAVSPVIEILRDITRGGFAGAIVGTLAGGVGGRIAMRLAALLVPSSAGSFTENGNRIGDITVAGSLGLVLFGLIVGLIGGTIWVILSPWIPGRGLRRAILTMPLAVALGATGLIDGENPDFFILRHDPVVVALLLALVALIGLSIPLIDDWLDGRLPQPMAGHKGPAAFYTVVGLLGGVLVLPLVALGVLGSSDPAVLREGLALLVVGLATLGWWALRVRGWTRPPTILRVAARAGVLVAVVLGFVAAVPEVSDALGMT